MVRPYNDKDFSALPQSQQADLLDRAACRSRVAARHYFIGIGIGILITVGLVWVQESRGEPEPITIIVQPVGGGWQSDGSVFYFNVGSVEKPEWVVSDEWGNFAGAKPLGRGVRVRVHGSGMDPLVFGAAQAVGKCWDFRGYYRVADSRVVAAGGRIERHATRRTQSGTLRQSGPA